MGAALESSRASIGPITVIRWTGKPRPADRGAIGGTGDFTAVRANLKLKRTGSSGGLRYKLSVAENCMSTSFSIWLFGGDVIGNRRRFFTAADDRFADRRIERTSGLRLYQPCRAPRARPAARLASRHCRPSLNTSLEFALDSERCAARIEPAGCDRSANKSSGGSCP